MRFPLPLALGAVALATLIACTERGPSAPESVATTAPNGTTPAPSALAENPVPREQLARDLALSLASPSARALLKAELDASSIHEHKLHFQRLLGRTDGRMLRALSEGAGRSAADARANAEAVRPLELYFPVPAHRAAWTGGDDLLVATELRDGETPVAFDVQGRRRLLDPRTPPSTPVLALVPVETDFGPPGGTGASVSGYIDCSDCSGGASTTLTGGSNTGSTSAYVVNNPGLYLTRAEYLESFEGWLKGDPEFDIHILGRVAGKDSLNAISCSGRESAGQYLYVQRSLTWTGKTLLYTNAQLDSYKAANPGQGLRIIVDEDDDGPCVLKLDGDRVTTAINVIEANYPKLSGGIDKLTLSGLIRTFTKISALTRIARVVANVFLTNDDFVGNAVERSVTGEAAPFGNWIVKGENNKTNGYLQLEMK